MKNMKSKPIRRYPSPKYPTRLEVAARPGLLQRHQPPAWRNWPELTGAVGLFLLASAQGLEGTKQNMTGLESQLPREQIADGKRRAQNWLEQRKKASTNGRSEP